MKTLRGINRSGLLILLDKAFSAATHYIDEKLDERARLSAADTLRLPKDTSWPDIHQYSCGRSVPHRFRPAKCSK